MRSSSKAEVDEAEIRLGESVAIELAYAFLRSVHDLSDLATRPYLLSLIVRNLEALEARAARGDRVGAADVYEATVQEWLRRDTASTSFRRVQTGVHGGTGAADVGGRRQEMPHGQLSTWVQKAIPRHLPAAPVGNWEELWKAEVDVRTATFLIPRPEGQLPFRAHIISRNSSWPADWRDGCRKEIARPSTCRGSTARCLSSQPTCCTARRGIIDRQRRR